MHIDPKDQTLTPQLLHDGFHEEYETQIFKQLITPGQVVVVVGANIGYYTLIAARQLNGTGRVHAFEPTPATFEVLRKNVVVNGYRNVTIINQALSNEIGRCKLFLDKGNVGCNSFAEMNTWDRDGYVEVDVTTLDAYLQTLNYPKVDLLKIDTQGAEALILQGARETLKRHAPKIMIEF